MALLVRQVPNALVTPLIDQQTGVFDESRVLVPESLLYRDGEPYFLGGAPPSTPARLFDTRAIYAGFALDQFGHFLMEGIARLWYASEVPDLPIVWLSVPYGGLRSWQKHILEILGVRNPSIALHDSATFQTLLIPNPAFQIGSPVLPEYIRFLAQFPERSAKPGRKIWLSRSRLESRGGFSNEVDAERRLAKLGWTIFHPQEHDLYVQLSMLATAERIAGIIGAAFHAVFLLKRAPIRIDLFARGDWISKNYRQLADAKGLDSRYHMIPHRIVSRSDLYFSRNVYSWENVDDVVDALAEI